ncbi:MAG: mechanosensitive ion channel [Phycisphaerales bacterium]|nr:mechanosensitive ion channel [Phycisphaerales bacterium]NNM26815.1 mechanosensitive ion channel [Phycisphaerales bacterium]
MNRRTPSVVGGAFALLLAITTAAMSQDGSSPPVTPPAALTPPASTTPSREVLAARIAELEPLAASDEAARAILADYRSALSWVELAAAARTEAAQYSEATRTAPQREQQINEEHASIRAELDQPPVSSPAVEADPTRLEAVTKELEQKKAELEVAKKLRSDVEAEANLRSDRSTAIPREIAEAQTRLEAVNATLASPPDPGRDPAAAAASRARLQAEFEALNATIEKLTQEQRSYEARKALLPARLARARDRVTLMERRVQTLQEAGDAIRSAIARKTREEAERAQREALNAHAVVQDVTARNSDLTTELTTVSQQRRARTEERGRVAEERKRLAADFEKTEHQVAQVGLNDVIGLRLRSIRARLPRVSDEQRRVQDVWDEIRRAQSRSIELDGLLVEDVAAEADRRLRTATTPVPEAERPAVLATLVAALEKQNEYVRQLQTEYNGYIDDALLGLRAEREELLELTRRYIDFIDERVLWIRSAEVVGPADVPVLLEGLRWLASPSNWLAVGRAVIGARGSAVIVVVLVAIVGILLIVRRRLVRRLDDIAKAVGRITTDRFGLSVWAAVITTLLALPWPLLLLALAWRIDSRGMDEAFPLAVADALRRTAVLLFSGLLLLQLCRPRGLADAHLRWRKAHMKLVRHNVGWLMIIGLPLAFVLAMSTAREEIEYANSMGRAAFVIAMIAVSVFVARIFHPVRGVLYGYLSRHRGGWLDRLKYVWWGGLVATPIAFGALACVGFFYTAIQLERRVLESAWLILVIVIVQALLVRGLYVAQRRLNLEQARKRAAQAKSAAADAGVGVDAPEPADIDVAAVSAQTRRLLHSLVGFTIILGVLLIWADVLPAFGFLRNVTLWSTEGGVEVASAANLLTGEETTVAPTATDPGTTVITLADLGRCLVIVLLTIIISRNIPGVLEIAVLQRLPITGGARYAIATLVRYTLVIVGLVLAFQAVGIGWSKVQWLAAAVTVGLGFGLQEIFANFVSGLILLFERPIRVGDTVTVGTVNGTVAQIRMRATTVSDWDRKELIIPNKEFVTGQIVNWSLSDPILRVRVPVGVAYGSDTALARKLMLQVAAADDRVLDEPKPTALFLGFGDSTLNLELRVFIPHIDDFMPVRDTLHTGIDRAFREAGVEIAFPQRDLHVRSLPPELMSRTAALVSGAAETPNPSGDPK